MTACRIHLWSEDLLLEEWRASVPKEVAFKGWSALDAAARRIEEFQRRYPDGPVRVYGPAKRRAA